MKHTFPIYVVGFLCLICIQTHLYSQEHSIVLHNISAQDNTKPYTEKEIARIEKRLKLDLASIDIKDKEKRKFLESAYKAGAKDLLSKIINHELLFDSKLQTIVDQLSQEIYQANPHIPNEEISIWVSRTPQINAVTYMNGTIIIYAGLISRMRSMDELAFVLCHEIAHYLQMHSAQDLQTRLDFIFSEATAKGLKKINSSTYNRVTQYRDFMEEAVYKKGRHSRQHELEADSIGLELLRRTSYQSGGAIETLELLDSADQEIITLPSLKNIFDNPNFAFKSSWLIDEEESFITGSKFSAFDADSLKTHPDCQIRIQKIKPFIDPQTKRSDFLSDGFQYLNTHLSFEIVEYYHDFGNYGRMIHEARKLLVKYPQNAYLHSRIGLGLLYIWQAQLNHEKGKVLDFPNPRHSNTYAETIRMLHNMRLSEFEALSKSYIDQHRSSFQSDEHYLFCMIRAAEFHKNSDYTDLKQQYLQEFPEGLYIHVIQ